MPTAPEDVEPYSTAEHTRRHQHTADRAQRMLLLGSRMAAGWAAAVRAVENKQAWTPAGTLHSWLEMDRLPEADASIACSMAAYRYPPLPLLLPLVRTRS